MTQLATAGELNTHLQRDIAPDVADQALTLASGAVVAYCGWGIAEETTTLQGEGNGSVVLTLPTLALHEVTAIRVAGVDVDLAEIPPTVVWSKKGQLFRAVGWPTFTLIEVDCRHGYNPIPDLIKLIVLEKAGRVIDNPQALISATTGGVSRTWSNPSQPRLSALDERLLQQYTL